MATANLRVGFWVGRMAGRIAGILLLGASLAPAQLPTGTISGRVVDASGAVVPSVSLTARNVETGQTRTAVTGGDGSYRFPALPVGSYEVRAEHAGFRTAMRSGLTLAVTQEAVVNFTLEVGGVEQTVEVSAEASLVNTTSGALGGLVNEQKVSDLPLNGRNFNDLVLLQPGVGFAKSTSTATAAKGLFFSSNGSPVSSNFMMLDGANLMNILGYNGVSSSGSMLGVEGIREFQVITNFFPAEYGLVMGGQVVVVSKGGTNAFHGSAFEFLRNSALDARNFFDRKLKPTDPRLPAFRRNNFGGSFGGPIRQDKSFFFVTYEGVRESMGLTQILSTPNAQARQDGFLVPTIAVSVKPYLALYPLPTEPQPNDPTGASGVGRFTYVFNRPIREDYGSARWDYNFSEGDSLFIRYTVDDVVLTRPATFPNTAQNWPARGQYMTLSESHTVTPALLNLTRLSYSRSFDVLENVVLDDAVKNPALAFREGLNLMGTLAPGSGISGLGPTVTLPRLTQQQIFTVSNDIFWSRGVHSLKFGTLINRYNMFGKAQSQERGAYSFNNLQQFLLGNPRQLTVLTPGSDTATNIRWWTLGFYLQDDWRAASRLTLNLGLRYEFYTAVNETTGHGSSLRDVHRDAQPTLADELFINPSRRNFSPRVGFAWDILGDGSTSLRSGFGLLYHLGSFGAIRVTSADGIPPFGSRSTVTSNVGFPRTVIPPESVGKEISVAPDYHIQQPHVLQYHLTLERQLPASMVVSVSYAGSRGINLFEAQDGNPTVPTRINGREFWTGSDPRINPNWGFVELRTTGADSWYNSLQLGLQKRLSHGLQFQSSYTYSKVLDTPQGQQNSGESGGGNRNAYGVNPSNRKYDKGPADFDHAHVWSFNLLEQLPSPGLPGIGRILDSWRVGTIVKIQTGQRFSPILSGNRSRSQVQSGSQNDRPDLVPGREPDDIILGGPDRYFDPTAFVVQPAGFLGTASRNMLTGPGQVNMDFSITKHFPLRRLGEGTGLEFRTEIFNLFNRANFFIPNNGAQVYTGTATVASTTPLATAGQIDQTLGTSRQLQFALKLIF